MQKISTSSPLNKSIQEILKVIKIKKPYLIGIAGVPGAGKSTISALLSNNLPRSKIVPMDGYHYYRNQLSQQGAKRRGAAFTFNKQQFKQDIMKLKQTKQGSFPSFDHKLKDPIQNDIKVTCQDQFVIVEGLYLFYDDWGLNNYWDLKIWVECNTLNSINRIVKRNYQAGISPTMEQSILRVNSSDRVNLEDIITNSNLTNAIVIQNSDNIQF